MYKPRPPKQYSNPIWRLTLQPLPIVLIMMTPLNSLDAYTRPAYAAGSPRVDPATAPHQHQRVLLQVVQAPARDESSPLPLSSQSKATSHHVVVLVFNDIRSNAVWLISLCVAVGTEELGSLLIG